MDKNIMVKKAEREEFKGFIQSLSQLDGNTRMQKLASAEQALNEQLKTIVTSPAKFSKIAEQTDAISKMLMTYAYMSGLARKFFATLDGEVYDIFYPGDGYVFPLKDEEGWELRYPLQPNIAQLAEEARVTHDWEGPYSTRVHAGYVYGAFSSLETQEITKHQKELAAYSYNLLDYFKNALLKQLLEKEDRAFVEGLNMLVGESEQLSPGISVLTAHIDSTTFDWAVLADGMSKHQLPARLNQPIGHIITADVLYRQYAKVPQTAVDKLSRDFMSNGFGDPDAGANLFGVNTLRSGNAKWFIYAVNNKNSFFGQKFTSVDDMAKAAGYNTDISNWRNHYNIDPNDDAFIRVYITSPRSWLGAAALLMEDAKVFVETKYDIVNFFGKEDLTYIFHNIFAVTVVDFWFDQSNFTLFTASNV